jgi:glycosyltransferase involved in cell wall biosynthesis
MCSLKSSVVVMKVLYFVHTFGEKNGIAIHLKNLIKFLPADIIPTVIHGKGRGLPFFSSLRVPILEILPGVSTKCDIIHIHGYGNFFSFFGALLATVKNVPLVWTIHGYPRIEGKRKIFYYVYRYLMAPIVLWKAAKIISVSDDAALLLSKETDKKITILPNGVDLDLFVSKTPYKQANYACYIGRLDKDKVPERLFEIDLPLMFIGPDENSGLNSMDILVDRETIFGQFEYEAMPRVYDKCRYVVLPSKYEGFPLTLLEAIAMQRPFVSTDVGQVRKTFLALGLGDLFLLKNNENLGKKINDLEQTKGIEDILARARLILEDAYSWKTIAMKTGIEYTEALI